LQNVRISEGMLYELYIIILKYNIKYIIYIIYNIKIYNILNHEILQLNVGRDRLRTYYMHSSSPKLIFAFDGSNFKVCLATAPPK